MSARLRRDIAQLVENPPADVIFAESGITSLESVTVVLNGPEGTPFSGGAWKVTLKLEGYPTAAPKAYFNTKIFHPNVDPQTGEVCVDTLKRDWSPDVDLSHILLTIRCLLIEPNPDSSLNEDAGRLIQEDYSAFEKTARLMTRVHALTGRHEEPPVDAMNESAKVDKPRSNRKIGLKRL
ncbi:ubiquitin-conjugating enzyme E2 1 [Trichomonascus vanleenenianus]|uniref:ubiquitin-conjugating enzyme E2 1 n=1 Tax=Trichomonascus vanleenenianus TaxID=2268995 RepID=UPI003ECB66CD